MGGEGGIMSPDLGAKRAGLNLFRELRIVYASSSSREAVLLREGGV